MEGEIIGINGRLRGNDWSRSSGSYSECESTESIKNNDDDGSQEDLRMSDRADGALEAGLSKISPVFWGQVGIFVLILVAVALSGNWQRDWLDWVEDDFWLEDMPTFLYPDEWAWGI